MKRPGIKLMADYQCWPLWHHESGEVGNIDPRRLGLSAELQSRLKLWAEVYESHLNWNDPASTHWTEREKKDFDFEGRRLCVALAQELSPQFAVFYFDPESATCIPAEKVFLRENA